MIASSLILIGILLTITRFAPVTGFVVAGMRRSSALLCPFRRTKVTQATSAVDFTSSTFRMSYPLVSCDRPKHVLSCTGEELTKIALEATLRVHEKERIQMECNRLRDESWQISTNASSSRHQADLKGRPFSKDVALLLLEVQEECAKEQLDKCVEACKQAAINDAHMSAKFTFSLANEWDEALNTKKTAMLLEMLTRELPIRLPGVRYTIGKPYTSKYSFETTNVQVDVTCDWGDDTAPPIYLSCLDIPCVSSV